MKKAISTMLLGMFAAMSFTVFAQTQFPTHPVRIVVPYPPGGIDAIPRMIAEKMRLDWGQPLIMEHKPGAGGRIAAELVAKSPPDGYTLLMGLPDTLLIVPLISKNVSFDVARDFTPVTVMLSTSFGLAVKKDLPVANIKELVAMAKAYPNKLSLSSWGEGSTAHLGLELFKFMAGVNILHVPYKGAAAAMTALVAGEVDMMITGQFAASPNIKSGRIRMIARTSLARSPEMPDVPTVSESYPGYSVGTWVGLLAPAGTPQHAVATTQRAVARAIDSPDVRARSASLFFEPVANTPDEFAELLRAERAKWSSVVRAAKIQVD